MKKPSKNRYLQELDRLAPMIRKSYGDWVRRIVDAVSVTSVERWIPSGNIDRIIRELRLNATSLSGVVEAVREVFKSGGNFEEPVFASARFTFDMLNPEAERWLREHSSELVTLTVQSQREAIAEALELGMRAGKNPRSTALDIIGRRDVTGRRAGGIVGLNRPQANAVGNAWRELSSNDPSELRNYLTRERRDRRFDATVRRAIDGKPLTATQVNQITGRYADRLVKLRGETIARTETIAALNAGRDQAWAQAIQEGLIDQNYITYRWSATMDARTRDSHRSMNNQKRGHGEPFQSPTGALLRYPGDTSMGAGPGDTINCFAPWTPIALTGIRSGIAHRYVGEMVNLSFGDEVDLSVTPNHPILTDRGWLRADEINEGDNLVQCRVSQGAVSGGTKPDVADVYSSAEQVYRSAHTVGIHKRIAGRVVNLHGHIPSQDVDVVLVNRGLKGRVDAFVQQVLDGISLADADLGEGLSLYDRLLTQGNATDARGTQRFMRLRRSLATLLRRNKLRAPSVSFGNVGLFEPEVGKAGVYKASGASNFAGNSQHRITSIKELRDALMELCSGVRMSLLNRFSPYGLGVFAGVEPQVIHAGQYSAPAVAGTPLNFSHRMAFGVKALHNGEQVNSVGDVSFPRGFGAARVVAVRSFHYEGPVYNFETDNGLIISSGIVAHNCRCFLERSVDFIAQEAAA